MKRTLLSIFTFALFFTACTKDDDAPAEEWYLSKYTTVQVGRTDTTTTTVKLSSNNTISEFTESSLDGTIPRYFTTQAVLEGNKLTQLKELDDQNPTARVINSLEYTGDKLAKINYYGFNQAQEYGITGYHEIVYNGQGKVAEIRTKSVPASEYTTLNKLTWEGENVKSVTVFNVQGADTSQSNTTNFFYDAKSGIHRALFSGYVFWSAPTAVENLSANNVVKKEIYYNEELYTRVTYERTYNERNQIKEEKEKYESLKDPIETANRIMSFSYTKK